MNTPRPVSAALCALTILGGCASLDEDPIIDTQASAAAIGYGQFGYIYSECQAYADKVNSRRMIGRNVVAGAILGILGGLVGGQVPYASGDMWTFAAIGASQGALSGAWTGAETGRQSRQAVLKACLENRGVLVLN